MVDLKFQEKFTNPVSLAKIKETSSLDGMLLIKKGMRLSVQPVEKKEYSIICKMGREGC